LEIKYTNKKMIKYLFSKNRLVWIVLSLFSINVLVNVIHYNLDFPYKQEWLDYLSQYCTVNIFFAFHYESYFKTLYIFISYTATLWVYFEYKFIHSSDFNSFYRDNIKVNTRWNNTCYGFIFLRIVIAYVVIFYIVKFKYVTENMFLFYLMNTILPVIVIGTWVFIVSKYLFVLVGLTNTTSKDKGEKLLPD
jgi:hypothetical protein